MAEFPTIAELLALAVAAGEGAVGALERVTRISRGELARELGRALADARAGASLVQALQGIATRTSLPPLARFVDGVAIAVERGTPLAEVLRAQAVDVREAGKRALARGRRSQGDCDDGAGRLPRPSGYRAVRVVPRLLRVQLRRLSRRDEPRRCADASQLLGTLSDASLSLYARASSRGRDRGDVPGWVLVTIMTAGLVTALWLVADDKLKQLFNDALDGVVGNAP